MVWTRLGVIGHKNNRVVVVPDDGSPLLAWWLTNTLHIVLVERFLSDPSNY